MIAHLLTCPYGPAPIKTIGEYDFKIAVAICITIVIVAFLAILGFLVWKWIDVRAKEKRSIQMRNEELADMGLKEKYDLLDKKLELFKELCYNNWEEKPKKTLKDFTSDEVKEYIKEIGSAIEEIKKR